MSVDAATEKAVDSIIERLLAVRGNKPGKATQVLLKEEEIMMLVNKSREIFMAQPVLLELEAPLKIVGDVHGQYPDLLRLFEYGGFPPEPPPLFPRTNRTSLVPPLVLSGHAASLTPYRWLPPRGQLPLPGRLRRPRAAGPRVYLPPPRVQNQVHAPPAPFPPVLTGHASSLPPY